MSRTKYTMTDAAAKRITESLNSTWQLKHHLTIQQVEEALREEDFWGSYKYNNINDLVEWMIDNKFEHFSILITQVYIREYYNQVQGITELTDGLQRLGVIPYPSEDFE